MSSYKKKQKVLDWRRKEKILKEWPIAQSKEAKKEIINIAKRLILQEAERISMEEGVQPLPRFKIKKVPDELIIKKALEIIKTRRK